jgi:crossover junction endodeoxyribonuclease RusA
MVPRMDVVIVLPWPPSVNRYYRSISKGKLAGRVLVSQEGRTYRQEVAVMLDRRRLPMIRDRMRISIEAFPPDRRRRDLDNLLKASLDALVFGGAIEDDSLIDDLRIRRGEVREGGELRIHIQGMHEA